MRPGGYLVACGAPRSYHRLASGIEDAGFEVRDSLAWLFGQGFPKSLNLDGAWTGWGTALKPGYEPIVMARKPFDGSLTLNVQINGTGALNVDACRVEPRDGGITSAGAGAGVPAAGRWPPNLVLTHSPDCTGRTCAPACPVQVLDAQSGASHSSDRVRQHDDTGAWHVRNPAEFETTGPSDSGGASRFFPAFRYGPEDAPFLYTAKTSRAERDAGLAHLPRRAAGEVTGGRVEGSAGLKSPRAGAGRTNGARNFHPTVKPLALMRWLVRLVTPPDGLVIDPFFGSGSTGIAAADLGFRFLGMDKEAAYLAIANARVRGSAPLFLDAPQ